jgi:nitroreductase
MDFAEVVRRRRMVRDFEDLPLPPGALARILAAARRAPRAGRTQGTELIVIERPAERERFWSAGWPDGRRDGRARAPVIVLPSANPAAYRERYARPDKVGAPVDRWPSPYWLVDAAFAAMLVLLAATDEGLGACFFGFDVAGVREALALPAHLEPIGAITIGHPRRAGGPGAGEGPS